jgi:hypothetical protein
VARGHLDALTAGGFAEGWAFDPEEPDRALTVLLRDADGAELGRGLARGYRADLARAGYRFGWCAFRLRLARASAELRGQRLSLHAADSGVTLHAADTVAWHERPWLDTCPSVDAAIVQDPTALRSVEHLAGCAPLLARFIEREGVAGYVHAAHAYLLSRAPDAATLTLQERLLRDRALTPFGLLLLIAGAEEFRREPRLLSAPGDPGFPFAG